MRKKRHVLLILMKKRRNFLLILCLSLLLISLPFSLHARGRMPQIRSTNALYDFTIVLDAGHGGFDGGACSESGVVEADVTLQITHHLKQLVQTAGFNVVLTRHDEQDLAGGATRNKKRADLSRRVEIINEQENALAVSIHANAIPNPRWCGPQVFFDAKSLENHELATHIMLAIRSNIEGTERVERPISDIYLLRHSEIPTALVEVGFLSHPEEAKRLTEDAYQQLMAYAIFSGILSYVENLPIAR